MSFYPASGGVDADKATITSQYLYHSTGTTGSVDVYKRGNTCMVTFSGFQSLTASDFTYINTGNELATKFRPLDTVYAIVLAGSETYRIDILVSGGVRVYAYGTVASAAQIKHTLTYITN